MSVDLFNAPYAHVAARMAGYPRPWAMCGGFAVDAWLGRETRTHGDFDIFVLEEDERALFDHLSAEWALIAHDEADPISTSAWDGRALVHPAHIHAMPGMEVMLREWVPNGADGPMPLDDPSRFRLDIMFNESDGEHLVLLAKPAGGIPIETKAGSAGRVSLPIRDAIRTNRYGLPSLVPEAVAFLKATAYWSQPKYQAKRPYDEADGRALIPLLNAERRAWLRDAIAALFPEHPWLSWPVWDDPDPLPEAPFARISAEMAGFDRPWAICGGFAVDAWLGRQTRAHGDFDITVLAEDQRALFEQLSPRWGLIAHDTLVPGNTTEPWDGRELGMPAHIHAMPGIEAAANWVGQSPSENGPMPLDNPAGFRLEILFNEREGDQVVLNVEPRVALPISESLRVNDLGLPALAPEALVFLKATSYWAMPKYQAKRPYDETDSRALLPLVGAKSRVWLRDAIAALFPEHPWLTWPELAGGASDS